MIFGDPSDFAFEIVGDDPEFCACILWVDSVRLGDAERRDLAGVAAGNLDHLRQVEQSWQPARLFDAEAGALLVEVFEGVFGDHSGGLAASTAWSERYGPLILSPNLCSSLDHCVVVVAKLGTRTRIVAGDLDRSVLAEVTLSKQVVDAIFSDVVAHLSAAEANRRASARPKS